MVRVAMLGVLALLACGHAPAAQENGAERSRATVEELLAAVQAKDCPAVMQRVGGVLAGKGCAEVMKAVGVKNVSGFVSTTPDGRNPGRYLVRFQLEGRKDDAIMGVSKQGGRWVVDVP